MIDPAILYTAYLGGSYADAGTAIAHDNNGFIYLAATLTPPISPPAAT